MFTGASFLHKPNKDFLFMAFLSPLTAPFHSRKGKRGVAVGVQVGVHRRGVKRRHTLVAARGSPPAAPDEDGSTGSFHGALFPL